MLWSGGDNVLLSNTSNETWRALICLFGAYGTTIRDGHLLEYIDDL